MATTVIDAYFGGNTFDELSTVQIQMFTGAPESATRTEVLNGANAAVLGDEIIQWTTATDLGDGLYELSGLLRGRRATEAYIISGHAVYERFVILDDNLVRLPLGTGVIGLRMVYRAVTFGAIEQNPTFDDQVTHIGGSALPAVVCNCQAVRNDEGVLIRWHRRDRLAWEWDDEIELPNSERDERYWVNVGLQYVFVYEPQFTYTLAMEAADFPLEEELALSVTVSIQQVSSTVGLGFIETFTLGTLEGD